MSDKFGEGRDPYLYPGLDIMRNRLNIRQQQRLEQAAYEMTALRAATIELGPLVRGLPHLRTLHRQLYHSSSGWRITIVKSTCCIPSGWEVVWHSGSSSSNWRFMPDIN